MRIVGRAVIAVAILFFVLAPIMVVMAHAELGLLAAHDDTATQATVPAVTTPAGPTLNTNPTGISAPIGQYISDLITWTWGIVGSALAAWILTKVPKQYAAFVTQQMLEKYGSMAIAQVAGAVKGWVLSVDVKNAVVAQTITVLEHFEPKFAAKAGDDLKPMIVAWLAKHGMTPTQPTDLPGVPVAPSVMEHNVATLAADAHAEKLAASPQKDDPAA